MTESRTEEFNEQQALSDNSFLSPSEQSGFHQTEARTNSMNSRQFAIAKSRTTEFDE